MPQSKTKRVMRHLSLRLPKPLYEKIFRIAEKEELAVTEVIRRVLEKALNRK